MIRQQIGGKVFELPYECGQTHQSQKPVWKDGQKVAEHKGPNCYNEERPFYLKLGVYKPAYSVTAPPQRVTFHDEIRIGNEKATYADAAPSGSAPPDSGALRRRNPQPPW